MQELDCKFTNTKIFFPLDYVFTFAFLRNMCSSCVRYKKGVMQILLHLLCSFYYTFIILLLLHYHYTILLCIFFYKHYKFTIIKSLYIYYHIVSYIQSSFSYCYLSIYLSIVVIMQLSYNYYHAFKL